MDRRDANIDLVFRNGLKDYEVLPPSEVWENVSVSTGKKRTYISVLKYAASFLIIASAGFLTYRLGLNQAEETEPLLMAMAPQITLERHAIRETAEPERAQTLIIGAYQENPVPAQEVSGNYSAETNVLLNTGNNISTESNQREVYNTGLEEAEASQAYARLLLYDDYNVLAESSAKPNSNKERWSLTALISPTFVSGFSSGGSEMAKEIVASDKPSMSYTGGVAFSYQISKRLSFQSGFYYSALGQNLSGVSAYGGFERYDLTKGDHNFEVLTGNGTIYTNNSDVFLADRNIPERIISRYNSDVFDPKKSELSLVNNSITQSFSYLELPMILRYKIVDKRMDINISGGLSSNLLVGNSVFTSKNGERYEIGRTEGVGFLTLSSSFGMGMEYSLTQNLSLNLEPTLRYYINAFDEPAGMKIHPYSFGIFSGISWKF